MPSPKHFAHTIPGKLPDQWEALEDHLRNVGDLCADFAGAFGAAEWGAALGYWHDLGKYSEAFQNYLVVSADPDASEETTPGRVDHSTYGAQHAVRVMSPQIGRLLAFCIAGHHAGMPNGTRSDALESGTSLEERLEKPVPHVKLPATAYTATGLRLPFTPSSDHRGFQVAFFTRLLFSALVDADRTATEAFCDPGRAAERARPKPSVAELLGALTEFLKRLQRESPPSAVNAVRREVLADCLSAAAMEPGVFSLAVPTGGGKTLSSLAFGLSHAAVHSLRRVVVTIPFTSIIEQTADEYRRALGGLAERGLVEHHSNIEPRKATLANQLAAENWDAPLIVTTNVQLFESLFAAATTPCRKLHRLAGSVIILDEAQSLPVELLAPTLAALRELVDHYGCSVVLCTATQPALERRSDFPIGLSEARPIVRDRMRHFDALKRVRVERLGSLDDEKLTERIATHRAALCVVNTRRHAARVYDQLVALIDGNSCFHLSTTMCANHRRAVLGEIRARLERGGECRVVSTQLVEAGVNLDFPVVYRAPAGFDSVAQAAGRCNREGHLPFGMVYLFETEDSPPAGFLRQSAEIANELAGLWPDPLLPSAVDAYFRQLYWSQAHRWDAKNVLEQFEEDFRGKALRLRFRDAARRYHLIAEAGSPVAVPYDEEASALIGHLLAGGDADYQTLRRIQGYLVTVRPQDLEHLINARAVAAHPSGLYLLANDDAYTVKKGLVPRWSGNPSSFLFVD